MKTFHENPLEQQLINELRRADALYRRALASLHSSLPEEPRSADEITDCLGRLQPLMQQAQEIELGLAPLRQEWIDSRTRPGAELRQILKQHEEVLKTLIGKINHLEQCLERYRAQAIPGMDRVVRHHQMQRAYQQLAR
ncbi:hypothetical protein SH661x_000559 [Planctomicrobium sp. SH661]|uniref:hypothetical protein n=1 Tax=Planctomicrobium sp. SH661 TaxID=3448124 RepID=UPI003F5BFD99